MTSSSRWKSKNLVVDPQNPSPLGVCDLSGFAFNRDNLVEQKEWRGNRLVGTNMFRGAQYIDTPQEQNRPPLTKADPTAVIKPRPMQQGQQVPPYQELMRKLQNVSWNSN